MAKGQSCKYKYYDCLYAIDFYKHASQQSDCVCQQTVVFNVTAAVEYYNPYKSWSLVIAAIANCVYSSLCLK